MRRQTRLPLQTKHVSGTFGLKATVFTGTSQCLPKDVNIPHPFSTVFKEKKSPGSFLHTQFLELEQKTVL